jgi:ferritin-like metal-binding protein YciE
MENLQELFEEQIQDLYSGESQIIDALPDMIEAAKDRELRSALEQHLEETKEQKKRLEQIARDFDFEPDGQTCKGMEGILEEGEELVENEAEEDDTRDAAIVAAAQRVEHYEMAGYGTARTYARMLGHEEVAKVLQATLDEEHEANDKLTRIAESHVNRAAMV